VKEGSEYYPGNIKSVSMLGTEEKIAWKRTGKGLEFTLPKEKSRQ